MAPLLYNHLGSEDNTGRCRVSVVIVGYPGDRRG
jgi:hypothetical protein